MSSFILEELVQISRSTYLLNQATTGRELLKLGFGYISIVWNGCD